VEGRPALGRAASSPIPPGAAVIEVHVGELRQLFNAIDPSPFRERDLDPKAEAFIVEWSREMPSHLPLALLVHVDRPSARDDEALLREAVQAYFGAEAESSRRRLRRLFHVGRISLFIGLTVLASCIGLARIIESRLQDFGGILNESLLIGGWVAMWRPLEVFLYDWWPVRGEVRLYDRLAAMRVDVRSARGSRPSGEGES
jgi:hypothetical protein